MNHFHLIDREMDVCYITFSMMLLLRVRAIITSQSWRPDLGQIRSIRNRETTVIAGYFEDFAVSNRAKMA